MKLKNDIVFLIKNLWDIPYSLFANMILFPLPVALKMPVFISRKVHIRGLKRGRICIDNEKIESFMVTIGIGGVDGISDFRKGMVLLGNTGKIVFRGKTQISKGITIRCTSGRLIVGNNFYSNCNLSIICSREINIGDDCLFGWNVHIRDCDGHAILKEGERVNSNTEVVIGNHVWVGQDVKILKGTVIPNDSVIAMNSCVTRKFSDTNTVIGGYPAEVLKSEINWEI